MLDTIESLKLFSKILFLCSSKRTISFLSSKASLFSKSIPTFSSMDCKIVSSPSMIFKLIQRDKSVERENSFCSVSDSLARASSMALV